MTNDLNQYTKKRNGFLPYIAGGAGVAFLALLAGFVLKPGGHNDQVNAVSTYQGEDKAALDALYQDAVSKGEAKLVITGEEASDPTTNAGAVYATFSKRFPGIKVVSATAYGADLFARIDGEYTSGNHQTSVIVIGPSDVNYIGKQGRLIKWLPTNAGKLPDSYRDPNGWFAYVWRAPLGLAYNTEKLNPEDVPHTIDELGDPKWKGKISAFDVSSGSNTSVFAQTELLQNGFVTEEQLKKIRENSVLVKENPYGPVAEGRADIGIWYLSIPQGAPVAFAPLVDGTAMLFSAFAILDKAPAPDAAKLLFTWLLTQDGQRTIVEKSPFSLSTIKNGPKSATAVDVSGYEDKIGKLPASEFYDDIQKWLPTIKRIWASE
ncbi:extracellular solute-binding protein [Acetobacter senegalensis]|uniref:ABC transporter substrate-binding protein n=1 Tax=Acetobacter senegalensis TaxID=446692 RepID=UPI00209CC8D4|nr:extracellular solute-binding protein [Acetobacter senegalensis]MCP1197697.1 extracellular solute-binding protein [Acetobacter senegalensis]